MKASFSIFFFFAIHLTVFSQADCNKILNGYVRDLQTHEAIQFANVIIENTGKGTVTDELGFFELNSICEDEYDLIVSFVGYKTTHHHHDSYHDLPIIFLAQDDQLLESVVIEGTTQDAENQTLRVESIDKSQLNESLGGSLASLVQTKQGVSLIGVGSNIQKPIIHGLHSNRVIVVKEGVKHEYQNWGDDHAPELDLNQVGSIEVIKGASTVRYGPEALGGVIIVNPHEMSLNSGLSGEIDFNGSSNGKAIGANGNLQYGHKHWVLAGQIASQYQGDLHTPEYSLTNTSKRENSYSIRSRYHKGTIDIYGHFEHFYQNLGILRGSVNENLDDLETAFENNVPAYTDQFSYQLNNPRQKVTHDLIRINTSHTTANQKISLVYAFQQNHRNEYDVRRGALNDIPSIDLKLRTHTLNVDWNHPDYKILQGIAGLNWVYTNNDNLPGTSTLPFVPNYNMNRFGVFIIENVQLGRHLLEFGGRYDLQFGNARGYDNLFNKYKSALDFAQLTGSLGYKYSWKEHSYFQTNIGLGWRPPNVSELYSYGKHGAALQYGIWRYDANDNSIDDRVQDQRSNPVHPEVGLKWINTFSVNTHKNQYDITIYANYIDHFFYTQLKGMTNTVRGAFPFYVWQQTTALIAGADMSSRFQIIDNLKLEFGMSYLWARDLDNHDVFMEMPPMRSNLELVYNLQATGKLRQSNIGIRTVYTWHYFQSPRVIPVNEFKTMEFDEIGSQKFDFISTPDGYFLPSLFWRASAGKFHWKAEVNNVFNAKYRIYTDRLRYFADQPGRNFRLSLSYKF